MLKKTFKRVFNSELFWKIMLMMMFSVVFLIVPIKMSVVDGTLEFELTVSKFSYVLNVIIWFVSVVLVSKIEIEKD